MKYDNEKCPVCLSEFKPGDDIVVCPDCGTPHHRDCWNKHNECANGFKHYEGFQWEPKANPDENPDTKDKLGVICAVCGTNCPTDFNFCPVCSTPLRSSQTKQGKNTTQDKNVFSDGAPVFPMNNSMHLHDLPVPPDTAIDDITAAEAAAYVQVNSKKYISKFLTDKKVSWNWAAFFFAPYWYFYRKIYKIGFVALALFVSLWLFSAGPVQQAYDNFDLLYRDVTNSYSSDDLTQEETEQLNLELYEIASKFSKAMWPFALVNLVVRIGCGLSANYLYKKKVVSDVKLLENAANEQEMFNFLALKKGGVSAFAAIGSIFIYQIIVTILSELPLLL
ncbi:MAG TPA: RING finger protein [Clostridia bacterium]|nr:RING finger protein [Clostridia bacterium]